MSKISNETKSIHQIPVINSVSDIVEDQKAKWILKLRAVDFMKQNDSVMIIPRLFGDGDKSLIACRLQECPTKERCSNLCSCDVECHCVTHRQSIIA